MSDAGYNIYKMVPVIVIMGTIFFLSHTPGDEIHLPSFSHSDLVAHMIAYGALGVSVLYAWSDSLRASSFMKVSLYTVLACLLYGISDEFHQSFIPGRDVSGMDVAADTVGAVLACIIWWFVSKKFFVYKSLS
jgi:VanZ family protein